MISISKGANKNYLCKLIRLEGLRKHPNADSLQIVNVDFQQVITGLDAKDGDLYVFFPLESQINEDFLWMTNAYREPERNINNKEKGFFEKKGRVKAVKLRGEPSMGYIVPVETIEEFSRYDFTEDDIDKEFDTIDGILMLKKYELPVNEAVEAKKHGKQPKRISRIIDGQIHLHTDTEHLKRNIYRLNLYDDISITYKFHGTSFWVSNVLGKKKLGIFDNILKKLGVSIQDNEYDYFYGSRKVVKNQYETIGKNHYYSYDLWGDIKESIKNRIPKGFTIYGECVGFTRNGSYIQSDYDYGCEPNENKLYIYRITYTNRDGIVNELSTSQMIEYCNHFNLNYVPVLYKGTVLSFLMDHNATWDESDSRNWQAVFIRIAEQQYTEKNCYICKNEIPEEGMVLRKESMFNFESYKLKSFRFLEYETSLLDKGVVDLESDQ